jgi:hypothetical protein
MSFCPRGVKLAFPVSFPDLMALSSRLPDELRTMRTFAAAALCRVALTLAASVGFLPLALVGQAVGYIVGDPQIICGIERQRRGAIHAGRDRRDRRGVAARPRRVDGDRVRWVIGDIQAAGAVDRQRRGDN